MAQKTFENSAGKMWLRDDGILQLVATEGVEVSLQHVAEFVTVWDSWTDRKLPVLIDRVNSYSTSFEALTESKEALQNASAVAYVVHSSAARETTEAQRSVFLEGVTAKGFDSEEEAVSWLKDFLE